jgi:hypothetical protein
MNKTPSKFFLNMFLKGKKVEFFSLNPFLKGLMKKGPILTHSQVHNYNLIKGFKKKV